MLKRLCPKCNKVISITEKYCDEHKSIDDERKKERFKKYKQNRTDDKEQKFYRSKEWKKVRWNALARNNFLCQRCFKMNRIKSAELVHHITTIKLDWERRLDINNLEPLCNECHKVIHDIEFYPEYLQPSLIPITTICGPPGSGKSTYVNNVKGSNDLVIDLDVIISELNGQPLYVDREKWFDTAIYIRNKILYQLSISKKYDKCWFILSGSRLKDREFFKDKLKVKDVIVFEVEPSECLRRIKADSRRVGMTGYFNDIVKSWWKSYERNETDKIFKDIPPTY